MTCEHCAEGVRRALLEAPGIASADVNLKTGTATVAGDALDLPALQHIVQELGYEAEAGADGE
jgi:Au+-exporting ATPase